MFFDGSSCTTEPPQSSTATGVYLSGQNLLSANQFQEMLNNMAAGCLGDPQGDFSSLSLASPDVVSAATGPNSFVLLQLTPSGWQLVVKGQLIPYACGVLGGQFAAQTILNKTNTENLLGTEFYLGYGTSALPARRFFNNNAGGHFFTVNEVEKTKVIDNFNWFRFEGTDFFARTTAQ